MTETRIWWAFPVFYAARHAIRCHDSLPKNFDIERDTGSREHLRAKERWHRQTDFCRNVTKPGKHRDSPLSRQRTAGSSSNLGGFAKPHASSGVVWKGDAGAIGSSVHVGSPPPSPGEGLSVSTQRQAQTNNRALW